MLRPLGDRPGPYVIGHRGAPGYCPENTMPSFRRALDMGVDAIEFDVQPTRDGQLVVLHDPTLDRTTNGHGFVSAHTAEQIQALDAGSWFDPAFASERVPLLHEVLVFAKGRTKIVIEIKQGPLFFPHVAEQLVAALRQMELQHDALVISFDHITVRDVKQHAPEIATGVLYAARCVDPVALARAAQADALLPYWPLLTKEEVEAAHAAELFIAPFGGAEQDYRMILAKGVDAVATDFPDRPRVVMGGM